MTLTNVGGPARRGLLLAAALGVTFLALGRGTATASVCGNGIVESSEECDPGGGTFIQGNPNNASCTSGGDCFFRYSCCKFNCQFVGNGPICDDGNDCTGDGQCIQSEANCTGAPKKVVGSPCGSSTSNACTAPDTCNGAGVCLANDSPAGTACGDPTSNQCNAPDTCNGAGTCLANYAPAGTPAGTYCDDGGGCTADTCDGSGGCTHTPVGEGQVCRGVAGPCDVAEVCTGGVCPADTFLSSSTVCRGSAGVCDVAETCTGSSAACPADGFVGAGSECRSSAGVCDVAESCTGSSAACPADGFASAGSECRSSAGVCDVAESCTGSSAACPADGFASAGTECRAAAGACDIAETCTGSGKDCPADAFASTSVECRAAAGACDVAEHCSGSGPACPSDGFAAAGTECRAAAGACDVAESCSGAGPACPADALVAADTECRPAAGPCDKAEACSGTDAACPADAKSTEECRASTGPCDPAEVCDGIADACPADALLPSGTTCDDGNPCTGTGTCDGVGAACPTGVPIVCPACEACDGVGGCVIGPLGICRRIVGKKAKLKMRNLDLVGRATLVWRFNKLIDETEAADFGDPTDPSEAGYDICIFQDGDPAPETMDPELLADLSIPAGSSWTLTGQGYLYKRTTSDPKGFVKVGMRAAGGVGNVRLKAKGPEVPQTSLPLGTPVVVHFQSQTTSTCWQAWYSTAKLNGPSTFKALADDLP
jgi:hypothetical protein